MLLFWAIGFPDLPFVLGTTGVLDLRGFTTCPRNAFSYPNASRPSWSCSPLQSTHQTKPLSIKSRCVATTERPKAPLQVSLPFQRSSTHEICSPETVPPVSHSPPSPFPRPWRSYSLVCLATIISGCVAPRVPYAFLLGPRFRIWLSFPNASHPRVPAPPFKAVHSRYARSVRPDLPLLSFLAQPSKLSNDTGSTGSYP